MSKYKEQATVVSQERIATDIYSLWIQTGNIAAEAGPGQFLSVYTRDESKLLPRPISICEIDKAKGYIRLVYRVTGKGTGTQQFAALKEGDQVSVMGPLGNGFLTDCTKKAFLIDLMIPKMSGMDVMKTIREKSVVPILIVSAKDSLLDKSLGLELGADDYITKPFVMAEVLARIDQGKSSKDEPVCGGQQSEAGRAGDLVLRGHPAESS